jgi:hypothetical protein
MREEIPVGRVGDLPDPVQVRLAVDARRARGLPRRPARGGGKNKEDDNACGCNERAGEPSSHIRFSMWTLMAVAAR